MVSDETVESALEKKIDELSLSFKNIRCRAYSKPYDRINNIPPKVILHLYYWYIILFESLP